MVLSLQLSFAVFPLVMFTGDPRKMGPFANPLWVKALGVDGGRRDRRPERIPAVADFRALDDDEST